jgi:hypothetical protein
MNGNFNTRYGDLIHISPSGKEGVFEHNLPFGVLQQRKKLYIQQGFNRETLKIVYSK